MKAMLLAAGRGVRMAPLTARRLKPTLPVLDEPLVLRHVRSLAAQGVESVVVNAHQRPEELRRALAQAPIPVELCEEPELRGNGGGILGARPLLEGSSPFLVLNADMCIEFDLAELMRAHKRAGALVTLLLRDDPRNHEFGTIGYASDGAVCRVAQRLRLGPEAGCGLFTGVHVMQPAIFDQMPRQHTFDIVLDVYQPWLREGGRIATHMHPRRAIWWPVGSPRELLDSNLEALEQSVSDRADAVLIGEGARLDGEVHAPAWIGAGAHVPADASVGPRTVIGANACVPHKGHVEESLLLPGARPPSGSQLRRAIGFDEEIWLDD